MPNVTNNQAEVVNFDDEKSLPAAPVITVGLPDDNDSIWTRKVTLNRDVVVITLAAIVGTSIIVASFR